MFSTGRSAATASAKTIPMTLKGIPSRNGITRNRLVNGRSDENASSASKSPRTHRVPSAPPVGLWLASAAQTVPTPRSTSRDAANTALRAASTMIEGARVTPAASHKASATSSSSNAAQAGGRCPTIGRPHIEVVLISKTGWETRSRARRDRTMRSPLSRGSADSRRAPHLFSTMRAGRPRWFQVEALRPRRNVGPHRRRTRTRWQALDQPPGREASVHAVSSTRAVSRSG